MFDRSVRLPGAFYEKEVGNVGQKLHKAKVLAVNSWYQQRPLEDAPCMDGKQLNI